MLQWQCQLLRAVFQRARACRDLQQYGHQMAHVKRFAYVLIHTGCQAGQAVAGHGIGGHGHDGQGLQAQFLADLAGGTIAVQHRHLDVHQDHIKGGLGGGHRIHANLAVGRQGHQRALGT